GDAATVIVAGPSPEVIVRAADPLAALAAIGGPEAGQRAQAGQGTADLATAIELASAALRSAPAATNDLLILAGSGLEGLRLNDVPARTTVKTIGSGGPNVGLVALDVRRPPGVAAARGYARIANLADTPAAVTLAIGGDGIPLERQTLRLEPRSERPLTFGVPAGVRDVEARLEPVAGTDLFPADNRSTASVGGYHRVVIFVGSSDDPVQRALGVLPGVTVRQLSPEQYQTQIASLEGGQQDAGSGSQPDVPGPSAVVFSGWLPERPPSLPALVIAPGGGSSWLTAGQSAGQARLIRQDTQSPLLRGVDLSGVSFGSVRPPDLPEWAASSAEVAGGPVIYQGSLEGRRVAVLAFDPQQSSLPKLPSFPVLLSNSLAWLAPAPDAADGVVMDPGAREREGDLRALVVPMPEAQPMALRPDRLIEAAWWQWLVAGAFLLLIAEWWRYGREAR
ncbi:MAG TPA: hypothetical protein VHL09_05115, partial [Dehalococcoidia bacterium]|nr:hypothetical protein [Dehalococcoidia bacterium]